VYVTWRVGNYSVRYLAHRKLLCTLLGA